MAEERDTYVVIITIGSIICFNTISNTKFRDEYKILKAIFYLPICRYQLHKQHQDGDR